MIKKIIKALVTGERLAGYSADAVKRAVNAAPDEKKKKLAAMAKNAKSITLLSQRLSEMLEDGTIDDVERDALQVLITPLFDRVMDLI